MARAAGRTRGRLILLALLGAAVTKAACDGEDPGSDTTDAGVQAVLADLGPRVVSPALEDAAAAFATLRTAAEAWRDAEAAGTGGDAEQEAARAAWWAAMEAWQVVELLQVGPAASSLVDVAGEDVRDAVYSWPTVNRCRVDQETVYGNYADADFFETSLVNVTGLDALEVLLYAPAGENDCPSQVDINADGSWDALGVDGVDRNRSAYAAVLAAEVARHADGLVTTWGSGGFGARLATPGEPDAPYASAQEALDAVFEALFYLELSTKDRKLGYALGVGECTEDSCIEDIESPIAGGSHVWVAVNLRAARVLYTGGDGAGLDDLLETVGQEELAAEVLVAFDAADLAAANVTSSLDAADPTQVQAVYDAVKAVTDLLKGDVATHLALQVPAEAAGDND